MNISRKPQGFTIVELLIVIVVIGILAAITIVAFNGIQSRAQAATLQSDLRNAFGSIQAVNSETGAYPTLDATASTLQKSTNTAYQYTGTTVAFCISATSDKTSQTFYVSNVSGGVKEGLCPGHISATPVAITCPTGYIVVPGNSAYGTTDFCVMKYEARNVSGVATSRATGVPWVSISQTTAVSTAAAACGTCHLITDAEWITIASNVIGVASNWSSGTVGSGYIYSGHSDGSPNYALPASTDDTDGYNGTGQSGTSNQRRTLTLTNGEVIWDFAGSVWEWTNNTIAGGQQPGLSGETAAAYKEWNNPGMIWNGLPTIDRPANVYSGAGAWSSTYGIGQLASNYSENSVRGFFRGGSWSNGNVGGVLSLNIINAPSTTQNTLGFRVSR